MESESEWLSKRERERERLCKGAELSNEAWKRDQECKWKRNSKNGL